MKTKSSQGNYPQTDTDETREIIAGLNDMAKSAFQGLPDETAQSMDDHWHTLQAFAGAVQ